MFVVSSSQLGAKEKHVANAMKLMRGDGIHHYWDGDRLVGTAVRHFVEGLDEPAWDLWMLYAPGRSWGEEPPEPDWWEHQLSALSRELSQRRLDARRFADKARDLAAR